MTDDATNRGSSSRVALLSAAFTLEWCLVYCLKRYDATGREGWVKISEVLCVCLVGIFSSYVVRIASSMWKKANPEAEEDKAKEA